MIRHPVPNRDFPFTLNWSLAYFSLNHAVLAHGNDRLKDKEGKIPRHKRFLFKYNRIVVWSMQAEEVFSLSAR